jgi:phage shock protein E
MQLRKLCRATVLLITLSFPTLCLATTVWIDVRTEIEHAIDSIDGDQRISQSEIVPEVERLFPDKSTEINLYCRSGGRAEQAATALENAGYTNVKSIGGIEDARRYRSINQ